VVDRGSHAGADVCQRARGGRCLLCGQDRGDDIVDVDEVAGLLAVAKIVIGPPTGLIDEPADDARVGRVGCLSGAVDVEEPKTEAPQPKSVLRRRRDTRRRACRRRTVLEYGGVSLGDPFTRGQLDIAVDGAEDAYTKRAAGARSRTASITATLPALLAR